MFSNCPHCNHNGVEKAGFSVGIASLGGNKRQRYKCTGCQRRFASSFHSIYYAQKKADLGLNAKIFYLVREGLSNRAIGRYLAISEHCVRGRLRRLSQQALYFQSHMRTKFKITEPICYDGLENFAGSQYDPNNINQALGRNSLFIYDFNFASLNRKGRMSTWQKRRLAEIEKKLGRYNPRAIRVASGEIFKRIHASWGQTDPCVLVSDEHFQYRRAILQDLAHLKFDHVTVSSKACRNFQNILFPVNHADLMIRQQLGAYSRETISFSKTAGAMCQRYALYMVHKNFMAPQFTKKQVRRPKAHVESPAQQLGICNKVLNFTDVFSRRSTMSDLSAMNREWQHYWRGQVPPEYGRHEKFVRSAAA